MATELAHAYVTIIPSLKGASKTIQNELGGIDISPASKGWGRSVVSGLGGGFVTAGLMGVKAIAAIGTAVGGLALGGGIARALKLDNAQMKFEAMGIDVESAMKSCNEAVTGTAYGLDAAATVASSLAASGVAAGEAMTNALKGVAGMAAMSGRSMEDIGLIFGKVAAQGKLQGDELTQFAESGVNATAALANYLGVTQQEVRELVKDGVIDFQTFADAMYATFGDAAQGANETFQGAMSNVTAALSRIGAKFASPALEGLRKTFVALIPAINAISATLDPAVEVFTEFVNTVSWRSVAGINAFTEALTNTGNYMSAFKAGMDAAFEGTAIGTLIGKINGFTGAVRAGTSPVALLNAYWAEFKYNFYDFAENSAIMAPINAVIRAFNAFSYAVSQGLGSTEAMNRAFEAFGANIADLPTPIQNIASALSDFGYKVAEVFSNINVGGVAVAGLLAGIFTMFGGPLTTAATALVSLGTKLGGVFSLITSYGGIAAFVSTKIATLGTALAFCGGPMGLMVSLLGKAKLVLMGFLTPVNLVVVGLAALAAAFAYLMTTNEAFRSSIMSLVANIGASLYPIVQIVGKALGDLASTVLPLITNAVALLAPVLGQIVTILFQLVAALAPVITAVVGTVVPIISTVIQLVVTLATQILTTIIPVIATVLAAVQTAMPLIQAKVQAVCNRVLSIVNLVWPLIQTIITAVAETVLNVIQTVLPIIETLFNTVLPAILSVVYAVWPVIQGVIEGAMIAIEGVISAVLAVIEGDWEGAWNIMKGALSSAWEAIKSSVSAGIDGVMNLVSQLPGMITGFFSNAGSWLLDAGANIISGLWNGISAKLGWLGEKLGSVGSFIAAHKGPKQYDLKLLVPNGGWIMQSLVSGIEKGLPGLHETLSGVTDSIAGAIQPDFSQFGAGNLALASGGYSPRNGEIEAGGATYITLNCDIKDFDGVQTLNDLYDVLARARAINPTRR